MRGQPISRRSGSANRLLHPRYEIPRVYEVEVRGRVDLADLPRWRRGAVLPDGPAVPKHVSRLSVGPLTKEQLTAVLTLSKTRL